ncbi:MAG: TIGR04282 family arsenosugar biosynthesis glycosyltransferase [Myxococcales bacterium]|nr:TIGR04282 family arsenosugar biosynthesis glycosyltransferase [Myxococcales bacterium]
MSDSTLVMFSKAPVAGTVKTRLAQRIGPDAAALLQRAFLRDAVTRFVGVASRNVLCCAPDTDHPEFEAAIERGWELRPQVSGDLGARMAAEIDRYTSFGPTVIVSSDTPSLPAALIEQAFESLARFDVVIGPAADGGYYLIGARRGDLPIFSEMVWGDEHVFSTTMERLVADGLECRVLPLWYDVDTLESLRVFRAHLGTDLGYGPVSASESEAVLSTMSLLGD